ncbi:MAG TPA: helix-turn-helix domain-containing protein [Longimicrobiaceae bacterium]|nr:helix-turn-helix domain-containing protein [Longimicrobiaceae bacterium]
MKGERISFPLPVVAFRPPYRAFEAIARPLALRSCDLAPGTVLGVTVREPPAAAVPALDIGVPRLRSHFPAQPVIVLFDRGGDDAVRLARRAGVLGARAVLVRDDPPYPVLRRILTNPVDLGADVVDWLALRGVSPHPEAFYAIREIFRLALEFRNVEPLLESVGMVGSTVRHHLQAAGLPAPGRWLALARALHAALRLQREDVSVLTLALDFGYSDHGSLSRQMLRLFGVRPGEIGGLLGWEWLVDRWVARVGRIP